MKSNNFWLISRSMQFVVLNLLTLSPSIASIRGEIDIICIYTPKQGTIYNNKRYFKIDEEARLVDGYAATISPTKIAWSDGSGAQWQLNRIRGNFSVSRDVVLIADGPCQRVDMKKF